MSGARTRAAWAAVLGGGTVLAGVLVYAGGAPEPEPGGVLPVLARDAAAPERLDAGTSRTIIRHDGAVQIHLPVEASPIGEILGPEELRYRRESQLRLIEGSIAEHEEMLAQHPDSTVVRARIEQLRARAEALRSVLAAPEPEPPPEL